ncbi:MAG: acyl-CoA dehydrogenase family protein, partial [Myxococcota bacterium]
MGRVETLDQDRPIVEAVGLPLDPALRDLEARAREVVASAIEPQAHEESDEAGLAMTRALGAAGLLDAGVALDVPALCVLREVVASSSGLADSMLALQGLGFGPIALAGSDALKSQWQAAVRSGEAIAALGVTEPDAGSDVSNIQTTAVRDGDAWVINGTKHYITNAGIADFYVVIARTGGPGARGLSAIVVPNAAVTAVERYPLIAPHPCGKLTFVDSRVPASNLVGEEG